MQDWNVVVSVNEKGFREAFRVLSEFGPVSKTDFFNVLVMKVDDIHCMLDSLRERLQEDPHSLSFLSRLIPAMQTFTFQSAEEFKTKAHEAILPWAPLLAGTRFHVRIHRRGFKGRFLSPEEERGLDALLIEAIEKAGTPGSITFDDPDAILSIETVSNRAGVSLWTRQDRERYPFIRLD